MIPATLRAALALGFFASVSGAQAPRFGPDTARLRIITSLDFSRIPGSDTARVGASATLFITTRITRAGGDTLTVRAVTDFVHFPGSGANSNVEQAMTAVRKGESTAFLMSDRGTFHRALSGSDGLARHFVRWITGNLQLPAQLRQGASWDADPDPILLGVVGVPAEILQTSTMLSGVFRTTYRGGLPHNGGTAHRFETSGSGGGIVVRGTPMVTVRQVNSMATTIIDSRGRMLRAEWATSAVVEQGYLPPILHNSTNKVIIDRMQ